MAQSSQAPSSDAEEPPSTPPEQAEEPELELGSSPANQRDLHQKKRRRSSGIPPMNFNNPEDDFSSSPLSGDNESPVGIDDIEGGSDDGEDVTAKLDDDSQSPNSSQSSAKLDAALRQASNHAGTQKLDFDDDDDVSMDMADDEITASFKPWAKKTTMPLFQDQENIDPFSAAAPESEEEGDDDMSMDITRAIGKIIPQQKTQSPETDDISMDLTLALGGIKPPTQNEPTTRRRSLKRRASLLEVSQGSPAKRTSSRRISLRKQVLSEQSPQPEDETMDFTVAIGGIKSQSMTKQEENLARRNSVDTSFGDETMDFTVAIGSIKDVHATNIGDQNSDSEEDEDLSMEFTNVIGGIKRTNNPVVTPEKGSTVEDETPTTYKTPTPKSSAKKSPGGVKKVEIEVVYPSLPQPKDNQPTPKKSADEPRRSLAPATPEIPPPIQQRIEDFEPSPFVHSTPQSIAKPTDIISTPTNRVRPTARQQIPEDPINAPILSRRRSSLSMVQFSPLPVVQEPTLKSTAILTNNIKLLSTPRKQMLTSPMKRGMTPKKSQTPQKVATPKQKTPTPKKATPRKSVSPRKRVAFGAEPVVEVEEMVEDEAAEETGEEVERISLQDFLDMTKIRFMDLSTTKRRHTAAPASFHDKELDEPEEESLDRYVIAAACTLPEFELYQHACHEMKKYISDGRHFVRTMEANVMEDNPLLFSEYLTAPPDQRIIMDNQFKNLKTSARLDARGEWYSWRSTLLGDLKAGLLGTLDGFRRDESAIADQEKLLDAVLPPLVDKQESLETECKQLQQRHDELNSCDREELEEARRQLVSTDAQIAEARRLVAQLQEELTRKDAHIGAAKERKVECVEEIKAAERVREECRGWSTNEVNELKGMFLLVVGFRLSMLTELQRKSQHSSKTTTGASPPHRQKTLP
jgi:kinetochore protein Spc7/SPC105